MLPSQLLQPRQLTRRRHKTVSSNSMTFTVGSVKKIAVVILSDPKMNTYSKPWKYFKNICHRDKLFAPIH